LFNSTSITNEAGQTDYPCYWSSTTHANWTDTPGAYGAYVAFGWAIGYMDDAWVDVRGMRAQRSDPKSGDPADYSTGNGPQGDAIRIYNYDRLIRDADFAEHPFPDRFSIANRLITQRNKNWDQIENLNGKNIHKLLYI
jgi:hypothetical protein